MTAQQDSKMTDYKITKDKCQSNISGVCAQCGGEITPIETVDNAGAPTYWAGCVACCRFGGGVAPMVYEISKRLVDDFGHRHYSHIDKPSPDDEEGKKYYRESQIGGASTIVGVVLTLERQLSTVSEDRDSSGQKNG